MIHRGTISRRSALLAGLVSMALLYAGCGSRVATVTPVPAPSPTAAPTIQLGFVVQVTPVKTRPPVRHVVRPTATPFIAPMGPYIRLFPNTGPPESRTIFIRGGNLPPAQGVQLVWSPGGHESPVQVTGYTDKTGRLAARFTVPGAPPGVYEIMAMDNGATYATASYYVRSGANLTVRVVEASAGPSIAVLGKHFVPDVHLVLIAYPISLGKPVIFGSVRSSSRGRFAFQHSVGALPPGQYILRALSTSAVVAQMAEAFFQLEM